MPSRYGSQCQKKGCSQCITCRRSTRNQTTKAQRELLTLFIRPLICMCALLGVCCTRSSFGCGRAASRQYASVFFQRPIDLSLSPPQPQSIILRFATTRHIAKQSSEPHRKRPNMVKCRTISSTTSRTPSPQSMRRLKRRRRSDYGSLSAFTNALFSTAIDSSLRHS